MSNPLPWFRLYSEFAKDPKIQSMTEPMQRRLIMLFCLQCSEELNALDDDELCCVMRIDVVTLHETLQLFEKKRFIDEKRNILNWDKRQYKSDSSNERVKKYREKQRVKEKKRYCNVTITPPDTDTDTELTPISPKGDFEKFWDLFPRQRRGDKAKAKKAYDIALKKDTEENILSGLRSYIQSEEVSKGYAKGCTAWLNDSRWTNEYEPHKKAMDDYERAKAGKFICG